ncbi:MAG TPA: hypothetical protein VLI40_12225 [Gemmatimonadaceae bacterium]|nr:hypothetical protein [Gemmatimonadaceae bacterium]
MLDSEVLIGERRYQKQGTLARLGESGADRASQDGIRRIQHDSARSDERGGERIEERSEERRCTSPGAWEWARTAWWSIYV